MDAYTMHPRDLRRECEKIDPNLYPGHPATRDPRQKWVTFTYETRDVIAVLHHFTGPHHGCRLSYGGAFVGGFNQIKSHRAKRALMAAHAQFPVTGTFIHEEGA